MSYKLEWNPSPNFTPGSQTKAVYGRARSVDDGAGHWWNTPEAGARHDGIVSIFKNPARQGSAHAVLSAGRVTEMVRASDTAWTTNNANPYTYSIEVDPRIMWKWTSSGANKKLGEEIFETLAEYIADKRYHAIGWFPHKKWWSTQCNPIHWNEVEARAKQIRAAKDAPKPSPAIKWIPMDTPRKMIAAVDLRVYDLKNKKYIGDTIKKGTVIDLKTKTPDSKWIRSAYSTANKLDHGIENAKLAEVPPPTPEWQKNIKSITPVKLQVLAKNAPIYNLNDVSKTVGNPVPQGTWIDFVKQTTVKGKVYLISKYSADNAMASGILKDTVGIPAPVPEPPKPQPEPEWLENWEDIADVTMYARDKIDVVNLLDGKTVTTIEKGTPVKIASATEWMGQRYLITEYSTGKKIPNGIRVVDLSLNPVPDTSEPIPEDPEKPVDDLIKENNSLLKQILALLQQLFDKITGK